MPPHNETVTTTYTHRNGEAADPEIDGYYWLHNTRDDKWLIFYWHNHHQRWSVGKYNLSQPHIFADYSVVRVYGPIVPPVASAMEGDVASQYAWQPIAPGETFKLKLGAIFTDQNDDGEVVLTLNEQPGRSARGILPENIRLCRRPAEMPGTLNRSSLGSEL